jgi:[NiFe] hydrogenase assembly HybE family chaperone
VYDPAVGDTVAQVPPGTPFEALSASWCCPHCDSAKARYLETKDERVETLVAEYEHIAQTRMKGLPLCHPRVRVEAVGFTATPHGLLGALVTPWSINAVLFPLKGGAPLHGHERALPGGAFRFLAQKLERSGEVELCSLFSPLPDFESHEAAVEIARQVLAVMLTAPAPEPQPEAAPAPPVEHPSRRDLLRLFRRG